MGNSISSTILKESSQYTNKSSMPQMYLAIHVTRLLNAIQIDPEARPPNALHRSMYLKLSSVLTCLICQFTCIGNRQYASETSDLNIIRGTLGPIWLRIFKRTSPRCFILSSGYPIISDRDIIEFSENLLAL